MPPTEITEDDSAIGVMCNDVFGEGWGSFKIAHLSTGDKIGIEIFEFPNAEDPENNFEYWKTGIFHFCIQDPDIESLAEKIVAHGGKQRMPIREYYPGEKPYRMVYIILVVFGAVMKLELVWALADLFNRLMAFPNLIGLLGLSGVVVKVTKEALAKPEDI